MNLRSSGLLIACMEEAQGFCDPGMVEEPYELLAPAFKLETGACKSSSVRGVFEFISNSDKGVSEANVTYRMKTITSASFAEKGGIGA